MGFQPAQKQTSEKSPRSLRVREKAEERSPNGLHEFPLHTSSSSGVPPNDLPITPSHFPFLQRTIGNRTLGRVLQAKLTVGAPDDEYEQEADRVAEQVMRMPAPVANAREEDEEQMVQTKPLAAQISPLVRRQVDEEEEEPLQAKTIVSTPQLQRKCAACESGGGTCPKCEEEEKLQRKPLAAMITPLLQRQTEMPEEEETLQTKTASSHTPQVTPKISASINAMRGNGQPLPPSARAFFEPRFGVDFSGVRVHTNDRAAETASAVNARAFTVGSDVAFGGGQYAPESSSGKKLLAHELAHVVQQNSGTDSGYIQRMAACPPRLASSDPIPSGWKSYHGNSCAFHCCYRGILEDRRPTPADPQNECFYDTSGALVDANHEYAGCRGTPNQYDSASSTYDHIFRDSGGIWQRGWGAFWTSVRHSLDRHFEREGQRILECHDICNQQPWYLRGFCLQGCSGSQPM